MVDKTKSKMGQAEWMCARQEAVHCFGGHKTRAFRLVTALFLLASVGTKAILSSLVTSWGLESRIAVAVLEGALLLLLLLPLFCGVFCVAISCLQGKPVLAADLFRFYWDERSRYVLFLCGVRVYFQIGILLSLADLLLGYAVSAALPRVLYLISASAACAVAVLTIILSLRTALTFFACLYLLATEGEQRHSFYLLSKEARQLLEGHYTAAVLLVGSFVGWFLLGALTFGVITAVIALPLSLLGLAAFFARIR